MKVYDITLDCDHNMLVMAETASAALSIAVGEAKTHNATVESIAKVDMTKPGLLAWYPGPFSQDAISEEEES